jgi:hypothetical protein
VDSEQWNIAQRLTPCTPQRKADCAQKVEKIVLSLILLYFVCMILYLKWFHKQRGGKSNEKLFDKQNMEMRFSLSASKFFAQFAQTVHNLLISGYLQLS